MAFVGVILKLFRAVRAAPACVSLSNSTKAMSWRPGTRRTSLNPWYLQEHRKRQDVNMLAQKLSQATTKHKAALSESQHTHTQLHSVIKVNCSKHPSQTTCSWARECQCIWTSEIWKQQCTEQVTPLQRIALDMQRGAQSPQNNVAFLLVEPNIPVLVYAMQFCTVPTEPNKTRKF